MTGIIYPSVLLNLYLFLSASILLYIFSVFCLLFQHLLNTNFSQQAFSFSIPPSLFPCTITFPLQFFFKIIIDFYFYFFKYKFIYFNWRLITLQYCIGFALHQHESSLKVRYSLILPLSNSTPINIYLPKKKGRICPQSNLYKRFRAALLIIAAD